MGRPSDYRPEYCEVANELFAAGATDQELADSLGVDVTTIYRWRHKYPEFCQSAEVKAKADERVVRSLYARATGYEHDDVDIRLVEGQIVKTVTRKHYPPDTSAAFIWLKNRAGWSDRQEITGADGKDLIPELPAEEVARQLAFILAQAAHKKDGDGA